MVRIMMTFSSGSSTKSLNVARRITEKFDKNTCFISSRTGRSKYAKLSIKVLGTLHPYYSM